VISVQAPLAIVTTYNDLDIAPQTLSRLLRDGIHVHVMDNWSTDGTFEAVERTASGSNGSMTVERFPQSGPVPYFTLHAILGHKENLAARFPGRWIIHLDSDEMLCSPWPDVSLHEGIRRVSSDGFSAITIAVAPFRPIDDGFRAGMDPETYFRFFEWDDPNKLLVRAWRQPDTPIDLIEWSGHQVLFEDRRIYPKKFVLKHYPMRNREQGARKVFAERLGRYDPDERAAGMHEQYLRYRPGDVLLWDPADLLEWHPQLSLAADARRYGIWRASLSGAPWLRSIWRRSRGSPLWYRPVIWVELLHRRARWWIKNRPPRIEADARRR
jgi:hypothetical protein